MKQKSMACEHIFIFLLDHILALRQKKTNIIDFKKHEQKNN